MEQIYYTQCPIGYGLGVSNGFQIKRKSANYPISGDFRHLGMRAYLPGTKVLAPPALRYRRDGEMAEIAWLTPRKQEYETERGLWGRPGGHFAHGLRLDADEMSALAEWPAGLFDRSFWKRTDAEPSRGRAPDAIGLGPDDLFAPPEFANVAPLAAGEGVENLARLLTALAGAVREGRTLFLIDEPAKLGPRVALLTFAFPEALRAALTFSTYHDRPEELPGFRLQGTIPAARPNRPALASLGFVADLGAGTFEPRVEPSRWASTLAVWLVDPSPEHEGAWNRTNARARRARPLEGPETVWSDAWFDRLFDVDAWVRGPIEPPTTVEGWSRLADLAGWASRSGLGDEWTPVRGPEWWRHAAASDREGHGRAAFVAHALVRESWTGPDPAALGRAWGEAAAPWLARADPGARHEDVVALLRATPTTARPGFLAALVKALPPLVADETLDRLKVGSTINRAMLLPLEVRGAIGIALERGQFTPLRDLLKRAFALPGSLPAVLDTLAAEAADRPGSRGVLTPLWSDAFEAAEEAGRDEAIAWALRRGSAAEVWLGPYLHRAFGVPHNHETWRRLRDRTPAELRPALARVVLDVAKDPTLPDEPFRWGVEDLLLPLPEAVRPHDPAWPDTYLKRTPSGLDLVKKLFSKEFRDPDLKRWFARAKERGEISTEELTRLVDCRVYARALAAGDARALLNVSLPDVPPRDRGELLGQILHHVGGASFERLDLCLDSCRHAWPRAFEAGSPGLDGLARPLAEVLAVYRPYPEHWLERLRRILDRLGVTDFPGSGFEPESLAAEVVAATLRLPGEDYSPWEFRKVLLDQDEAWRILAVDARRELLGAEPALAPAVVEYWDKNLEKTRTIGRFFELMLNACDGPRLAALVTARAADLRNLGVLPWWGRDSAGDPEARGDLREAFARLAPLAPLREGTLAPVLRWMQGPKASSGASSYLAEVGLHPLDGDDSDGGRRGEMDLSPIATARWRCVEGLSIFHQSWYDARMRWDLIIDWTAGLPLEWLTTDDRHRFLAWIILGIDEFDPVRVARLAKWLARSGMEAADRLSDWTDELAGLVEVSDAQRIMRAQFVGDLRVELKTVVLEAREGTRKPGRTGSP